MANIYIYIYKIPEVVHCSQKTTLTGKHADAKMHFLRKYT